ncbi:MAG: hypothetical protein V8K32_08720 [Candidatus Electrothrix gigas]
MRTAAEKEVDMILPDQRTRQEVFQAAYEPPMGHVTEKVIKK